MWAKEKYYRIVLTKKLLFLLKIIIISVFFTNIAFANLKKNIIEKFILTKTLTFNFKQKIADKEEVGNCFIKYPLLMKCNYQNSKRETYISNGKTVAIIKKKYKKIYYYPLKTTPLFTILNKEKFLKIIKNNQPISTNTNLIEFEFVNEKLNKLKIFFDKETYNLKGWKTKDVYSNEVSFEIKNLKINNQIVDDFFKIPKEEDL